MRNAGRRSAAAPARGDSFDEVVLPHLEAGHALARWLVGNEHDAEDVVQEAALRALRYFKTFAGGDGRAWFLQIVRNACWSWRESRARLLNDAFDEEKHSSVRSAVDPEALVLRTDDSRLLEHAMRTLPDRFRQLLVLRELEGLSYRELADVTGVPLGTVMSGLSRARRALRAALRDERQASALLATVSPREQEVDAVPV
jgi:RNA polymerase sigma-70 factor, ECF subfamily